MYTLSIIILSLGIIVLAEENQSTNNTKFNCKADDSGEGDYLYPCALSSWVYDFDGKTYYGCVNIKESRAWCPHESVLDDGVYHSGSGGWGFCDYTCMEDPLESDTTRGIALFSTSLLGILVLSSILYKAKLLDKWFCNCMSKLKDDNPNNYPIKALLQV
eukprot:TRINITY_DN9689_c0_g1_i1.p1 TRINITY_DN9689_c0_g1~~TRINITY_DN9689_c0_g1_i1.p1  ORF type:complete len:160 (+),score=20.38 TRINITY_DN9689_c0_g1_i1:1-480(+)